MSYYSNKHYLPNVSWAKGFNIAKYTVILPFHFDHCVSSLVSGKARQVSDANIASFIDDSYMNNQELIARGGTISNYRSCCYHRYQIAFPFPITQQRRLCQCISVEYKPELEQVIYICKPFVTKHALPAQWYQMKNFAAWIFCKLDEERTLHVQVHMYNAYGWAQSQSMNKIIVPKRGKDIQKSMLDYLQREKRASTKLHKDDSLAKCLADCNIAKVRAAELLKK